MSGRCEVLGRSAFREITLASCCHVKELLKAEIDTVLVDLTEIMDHGLKPREKIIALSDSEIPCNL
jgi:hypothetical protein